MRIVMLAMVMASLVGWGGAVPEREVVRATGPWEMEQATKPGIWLPARVPGTVLQTLVDNNVVPDPYWGVNNRWEDRLIPDLSDNRDFSLLPGEAKIVRAEPPEGAANLSYDAAAWNAER